jgi:hypothetical protein
MTIHFIDGFEHFGDNNDLPLSFPGTTGGSSVTFPTGRLGIGKCMRYYYTGYGTWFLYFPNSFYIGRDNVEMIMGFAFKVIESYATPVVFVFEGGSSAVFATGGKLSIGISSITAEYPHVGYNVIDSFPYNRNQWHYLEVKQIIGDGIGTMVVRLDEQEVINWTGDNRWSNYPLYPERLWIAIPQDWDFYIDDIYMGDTDGTFNNDFLGDVRIDTIRPNGAGNYSQMIPSAGNNYECVDEVSFDDSDYVEGVNAGDKDSYLFPDVPTDLEDTAIYGVVLRNTSQRTAGTDNIKIDGLIRTGSIDYNSPSEISLPDDWATKDFVFEKDPSDSAIWTQAKINACEFGMEVR